MGADGGHGGGNHPLRWTSPMSGFMLRRFVELIASGVKTDKGFKEVHLNQVAKNCSDHFGLAITGTQVYNHLRKSHISGSLWDDTNCVISLKEEHYLGHIKDHPKDVEYLSVPLENYVQMLAIFGTGIATGRYAMTSNEALGVASMVGTSPSVVNIEGSGFEFVVDGNERLESYCFAHGEAVAHSIGKRKRASLMSEEEVLVMTNMSQAIVKHIPNFMIFVMELPGFSEDDLLIILDYLNESANRLGATHSMQIAETQTFRWVIHHLSKLKDDVPKGGV
ncbi:hypothetical protein ZWY2020_034488 [Hordeum vulgare]|nr:hypothetical protein ZWY2020_034488 [Hordeum vulgare]